MASYQKFQTFVEHVNEGVHNMATGALTVALTNAANAPSASLDAVLADIVEISYTNLSSRVITTSSSSQSGGTYKLVLTDLTLTASGAVAPFRYVVIYNDTPTSPADPLICFFDYGSEVTMANGETFLIDFDGTNGLFSLT